MEEKRKRATGTANTIAAKPLNRIPSFMKNPRRERLASAGGTVTGLVDILISPIISPGVARSLKWNKAAPDSAHAGMPARQLHLRLPDRSLDVRGHCRASRVRLIPAYR